MVHAVGHVKHCSVANTSGGLHKNKPEWWPPGKEYLINNFKEYCDDMNVSSQCCIDSGCTVYCFGDSVLVTEKKPALKIICVGQSNSITMPSSQTNLIPIPQFSSAYCSIHVLLSIEELCLIFIGQLFYDGFADNFDTKHVYLQKKRLIIISNRYPTPGLYYIEFATTNQTPQLVNPTFITNTRQRIYTMVLSVVITMPCYSMNIVAQKR